MNFIYQNPDKKEVKMSDRKAKGWHTQPKYIKPTTEGHCPYCYKGVKSLEAHIRDKHKGKRLPQKRR